MSLRSLVPFLLLVFIVAVAGTFLALQLFGGESEDNARIQLVTVEVLITATPNPNASPAVRIITATPDRTQVVVPEGIVPQVAEGTEEVVIAPTIDPTLLGANAAIGLTVTSLPQDCILHVIREGDTPFGIAQEYGVNPFLMLDANNLTEEESTFLQIGETLIVPLEGCAVDQLLATEAPTETPTPTDDPSTPSATPTATPSASATPSDTPTVTPTPTITLAPTASNAQIQIVDVEVPGDITAEGVRIRNTGNTVDVTNWTLTDADGNEYVFPVQRIFSNAEVTVYTRAGENTPIAFYWGRDEAVWDRPDDIITLQDAQGNVQATARLDSFADG